MNLYNAQFSFEINEDGGQSIVYPTLGEAKRETLRIIKQEMVQSMATFKEYGSEHAPEAISATISVVKIVNINSRSMCEILNSNGGRYVASEQDLLSISMEAEWKNPRIELVDITCIGDAARGGV